MVYAIAIPYASALFTSINGYLDKNAVKSVLQLKVLLRPACKQEETLRVQSFGETTGGFKLTLKPPPVLLYALPHRA